jgi:HSP20 family protein
MTSMLPSLFGRRGALRSPGGDPFVELQREMGRLFEDFSRGWPAAASLPGEHPLGRVDVSETDKELAIEADLPGLEQKDVEITLTDDLLTIRGERKEEREERKAAYHLQERAFGTFSRSLRLPFRPDPDKVQARFAQGVLTLTIAKPEQVVEQTRKIAINAA